MDQADVAAVSFAVALHANDETQPVVLHLPVHTILTLGLTHSFTQLTVT